MQVITCGPETAPEHSEERCHSVTFLAFIAVLEVVASADLPLRRGYSPKVHRSCWDEEPLPTETTTCSPVTSPPSTVRIAFSPRVPFA